MKLQSFLVFSFIVMIALVGCSSKVVQQETTGEQTQDQTPTGQTSVVGGSETVIDQESPSTEQPLIEDGNVETTLGSSVKEFDMIVKRFAFEPNVIRVIKDDRVIIHAKSTDVAHSFLVPELNINERTPAGETVDIEFVADVKGEFDFRCGVPCGAGHKEMLGKIIVE